MKGRSLALVAGLGAALTVAALVGLLVGYGTTVGPDVLVNVSQPIDSNNSPVVARNPRRPGNLAVVQRVDRPEYSALLQTSFDDGSTWRSLTLPLPPGNDRPFAPDAAFGPDGTLYVLYVNLEGTGNTPANLWLATSADGGRTLGEPVRVSGKLSFQPRLAVGPRNMVHITWLQATDVGLFRLGGPSPIVASHSDDGGHTFSAPVTVSDPQRERVGAANPVVDSAGGLVVLYEDFKGDRRDFDNLEGPPAEQPFALVLSRSTDGGKTFSAGAEVESNVVPTRRFVVFLPPSPSLAAGPHGALYVSWADGRNGDDDVFLRRSTDNGGTWAPPVRVNDNRVKDGTSQYLPRVAVAGNGRIDVVFLDRRGDRANAYLASSSDGGRSFGSMRLSSKSFDTRVGPGTPYGGPDFGTQLGIDSHGAETFAAWTDTRVGTVDTGRQDIAGARVQRRPVWPIVVWPVLVGLVVVLALSRRGRRGRHRGPTSHS